MNIFILFAIFMIFWIFIDDIVNLFRPRCCNNKLNLKTIGRAKEFGATCDQTILLVEKCSVCGLERGYRILATCKTEIELEYAKEKLGLPINDD